MFLPHEYRLQMSLNESLPQINGGIPGSSQANIFKVKYPAYLGGEIQSSVAVPSSSITVDISVPDASLKYRRD